jgi:hypothetical protein
MVKKRNEISISMDREGVDVKTNKSTYGNEIMENHFEHGVWRRGDTGRVRGVEQSRIKRRR